MTAKVHHHSLIAHAPYRPALPAGAYRETALVFECEFDCIDDVVLRLRKSYSARILVWYFAVEESPHPCCFVCFVVRLIAPDYGQHCWTVVVSNTTTG